METISHALTKTGDVAVYLGSKRVGTIIDVGTGFAYVPAGQKRSAHGQVRSTVSAVLADLGTQ